MKKTCDTTVFVKKNAPILLNIPSLDIELYVADTRLPSSLQGFLMFLRFFIVLNYFKIELLRGICRDTPPKTSVQLMVFIRQMLQPM